MALSIANPEAERLVKNLARETGKTVTQAVIAARRERPLFRGRFPAHRRRRGRRPVSPADRAEPDITGP